MILAVSLALIALLVVTGGTHPSTRHGRKLADAATGSKQRQSIGGPTTSSQRSPARSLVRPPTTTTTTVPTSSQATQPTDSAVPLLATPGTGSGAGAPAPAATTTTMSPTTTTAPSTGAGISQSADRIQAPGVLDPPGSTSHSYSFIGTGAMQVSVIWSGTTYLTLVVSCPNGSQTVGGTSAMAAHLPDAVGACMATVAEPATESVALTYTITIGPTGA